MLALAPLLAPLLDPRTALLSLSLALFYRAFLCYGEVHLGRYVESLTALHLLLHFPMLAIAPHAPTGVLAVAIFHLFLLLAIGYQATSPALLHDWKGFFYKNPPMALALAVLLLGLCLSPLLSGWRTLLLLRPVAHPALAVALVTLLLLPLQPAVRGIQILWRRTEDGSALPDFPGRWAPCVPWALLLGALLGIGWTWH
jgi:hypothetical protein